MVLEGLDVAGADADQRPGVDRQSRPGRRREDDLARPRQQPGRQLEARVLLADDEHPSTGVGLDRPDLGVVVGELHARPRRRVRLGDADGHDQDAAAVDAVGRLDDEPLARPPLPPGASPSSGSHTGSAARPVPRRPRGWPPSRPATGSTSCRPSARPGAPGSPVPRRAGCSSRSARRRGCRARPGHAAWSTTAGAAGTASAGTSRRATDRPRSRRARRRRGGASTTSGWRPARCR